MLCCAAHCCRALHQRVVSHTLRGDCLCNLSRSFGVNLLACLIHGWLVLRVQVLLLLLKNDTGAVAPYIRNNNMVSAVSRKCRM